MNSTSVEKIKRTDAEWVAELSGDLGPIVQEQAIDELARYLFVVIYNKLLARRQNIPLLRELDNQELAAMTTDFTQEFMEKMVRDQYALLKKYHAKGQFTKWAAQVAINIVRSEFRKACWLRQEPLQEPAQEQHAYSNRQPPRPELALFNGQFYEILDACIHKLPSRTRTIFIRSVIDGDSTSSIAEEMGVTTNTIYLTLHRAKKKIQAFLADAGYEKHELFLLSRYGL